VDLFDHVNRRMRADGSGQIPVVSSLGVDDRIVVAGCPQGPAPQLVPLSHGPLAQPAAEAPGTGPGAPQGGGTTDLDQSAGLLPRLRDVGRDGPRAHVGE
jgi:hypothetical protein